MSELAEHEERSRLPAAPPMAVQPQTEPDREPTEHERMSELLSELDATFEAITDAIGVYDRNGRIIRMNAAARAMLGLEHPLAQYTAAELGARMSLRSEDGRLLPLESWPLSRALNGEALTGADAMDVVFHSLDGHEWHTSTTAAPMRDATGDIIGAVLVVRDVTERRRLEQEAAAKAREVEAILSAMADGVAVFDSQGQIVRCNNAYARLFGFERAEDVARLSLAERAKLVMPRDASGRILSREAWPLERALRGEVLTGERAIEIRYRTPNEHDVIASVTLAPLRDDTGNITGAVAVTRDVTQRTRLEQERLDSLRAVAHDLANPLAAISLAAQRQRRHLQRTGTPYTPEESMLESIEYALARMNRLLEDLRVAAGEGAADEAGLLDLRRERFDLAALCRQEAEAQRARTGREVRLKLPSGDAPGMRGPAEVVEVEADRERIGRVLANFLSNALKYSPTDRPVTVELCREQGWARVGVRDEGPGIPANEQARIWERFHRVPGIRARDGSSSLGLGLFICKAIIVQHGGHIGVESAVDRGSTFWFTLPLAPALAEAVSHEGA